MKKKDEEHRPNNNEGREVWLEASDVQERPDEDRNEQVHEDEEEEK